MYYIDSNVIYRYTFNNVAADVINQVGKLGKFSTRSRLPQRQKATIWQFPGSS